MTTEEKSAIPQQQAVGYTLQASQWHQCPVLIDVDEMRDLLMSIEPFSIIRVSGVIGDNEEILSHEYFLECYRSYIAALKEGKFPDENKLRSVFSSILTRDLHAVYRVPLKEDDRCLIKVCRPVVQLQNHRLHYSLADGKFRSMVFGNESIYWGIQFSFPRLFQDERFEVFTVKEGTLFPNAALFKQIQIWLRRNTRATPFEVDGKRVFSSARIGNACFSWINNHPQLIANGLKLSGLC